ncbi:MAG: ABATE domain-containing protein [Gemmatimonadota bacterium]
MAPSFVFDGNLLCLDFLNTRLIREGVEADLLDGPAALVAWVDAAQYAGLMGAGGAMESGARAGNADYERALRLRRAIRAVADAALAGEDAPEQSVAEINAAAARTPVVIQAEPMAGGWAQVRVPLKGGADGALSEVARSALELLTDLDAGRVGRCAHTDCVLYFYDTTRNRSRRWCSMERCGNRAKVAAHYRRQRAGTAD